MRLRLGVLALVLAAGLTGCGGDDTKDASGDVSTPTSPETSASSEPSVDTGDLSAQCAKFLAGQQKAAELQQDLTSGADLSSAMAAAAAQFDGLKQGAPADIQKALDEVKAAFLALGEMYKNPTSLDAAKAQELTVRLTENAQKLNAYVVEKCGS
ncbi:MAG: hypothetical protein NTV23_15570 [Propionibacteriales bacterium]|nr:hypothetical protein [Propionibacteriales bacterium]